MSKKLKIELRSGKDLPAADSGGTSDPYCYFVCGKAQTPKSKHRNKTLNPTWNETFELAIEDVNLPLVLKCYDHDTFSSDDNLGESVILLRSLVENVETPITVKLSGGKAVTKAIKAGKTVLNNGQIDIVLTAIGFGLQPGEVVKEGESSAGFSSSDVLYASGGQIPYSEADALSLAQIASLGPLPGVGNAVDSLAPPPVDGYYGQPDFIPPQGYLPPDLYAAYPTGPGHYADTPDFYTQQPYADPNFAQSPAFQQQPPADQQQQYPFGVPAEQQQQQQQAPAQPGVDQKQVSGDQVAPVPTPTPAGPPITLSPEQIEHARSEFNISDVDKSGLLDATELNALLQRVFLGKMASSLIQRHSALHFNAADRDQSGTIDFNEFIEIYTKIVREVA